MAMRADWASMCQGMGMGMGMGHGNGDEMEGTPLQLKRRVHVRVIIGAKNCTTVKTK